MLVTVLWILFVLLLPLLAIRWLRWLAIVQQKEYRLDRLNAFFQSEEGRRDALKFIPSLKDFTRTGLKRPVRTARISVIALISAALIGGIFLSSFFLGVVWLVVITVAVYVFLPCLLLFSDIPTTLYVQFETLRMLKKAQKKLQLGEATIIGIGGSYGKTSTKHILAHLLSQKYSIFVTPKSHNTQYSVAQSIIKEYANQKVALLEYGSYKLGEIAYLTQWFPPVMAIETGFTLQHLGLFGSVENSEQAEAELIAALPLGQKVFCNAADEGALKICQIGSQMNRATIVPYTGPEAVVRMENITVDREGKLSFSWRLKLIQTKLVGKHYIPNIQAAIAVSLELGLSEDVIAAGLESFEPNTSFVRSRVLSSGALLIDDGGTSNPKGFSAAIELVKSLPQPRKILISGGIVDLGKEAEHVHQDLATQAKQVFQSVAYVGMDGHTEFNSAFAEQFVTDQEKVKELIHSAKNDSVILVEGKIPKWTEAEL